METQIWLRCHNKFISAENITLLSVSSDDFLHAILEVAEQQMWNYSSYVYDKKSILKFSDKSTHTYTHTRIRVAYDKFPNCFCTGM